MVRFDTTEVLLLCGIAVCSLLSLGLVSLEGLGRALLVLLAWGVVTTLLVGSVGVWVAWARAQHARRAENARAEAR